MLSTSALFRLSACITLAVVLAPHAQAADPIKVGVVTPLSGTYAPIGKQVRWGAELAVKDAAIAAYWPSMPIALSNALRESLPPVLLNLALQYITP